MSTPPIRRDGRSVPLDQDELRRRRMERGLSQRALATKSGVSQQQISALETGVNGASPEVVARLARALRCRNADLMDVS